MKRVWKKLHNRSGASLLFAILVFMLCILAGTGALTAAAANAGRFTHLEAEQQRYLTMGSAAGLLRDALSDQTFTATLTTKKVETTNLDGTSAGIDPDLSVFWTVGGDPNPGGASPTAKDDSLVYEGDFREVLIEKFEEIFLYELNTTLGDFFGAPFPTAYTEFYVTDQPLELTKTYTIKLGDLPTVNVEMTVGPEATDLQSRFHILIKLTWEKGGKDYLTTVRLLATTEGVKDASPVEKTEITTTGGSTQKVKTTTTEYTLKVEWKKENAFITEEAIS